MTVRQYVGARYVPKFYQNSQNPLSSEWEGNKAYEAMTIVTYNNSSYTSKIPVPAGVGNPAQNPTYWVITGNYNAQVEQYRQETEQVTTQVTNVDTSLNNLVEKLDNYEIVNVKDYGAKGDGTTDDSLAFTNALNSGKPVYVPSGTYLIETTIAVDKSVTKNRLFSLEGSGQYLNGKATIKTTGSTFAFHGFWGQEIDFDHLVFEGNGLWYPAGSTVTNCEFRGSDDSDSIGIKSGKVSVITNCYFRACKIGIDDMSDCKIIGCSFSGCTKGIYARSNSCIIIGNRIEWCSEYGINIGGDNYTINSNDFDRNQVALILNNFINSGVVGNNFKRSIDNHVTFSGTNNVIFSNNSLVVGNSEDDQSGTAVPPLVYKLQSLTGTYIINNNINETANSYPFTSPDYMSNSKINDIVNGKSMTNYDISLGVIKTKTDSETTVTYSLAEHPYLGSRGVIVQYIYGTVGYTNTYIPEIKKINSNENSIDVTLNATDTEIEMTLHLVVAYSGAFNNLVVK